MLTSFEPHTRKTFKPKFELAEAHVEGIKEPIVFIKRLSPETIVAATSEHIYLLNVRRAPRISKVLERPEGAFYVDATPKTLVFARYSDVYVTDLDGNELFIIPLGEKPISVAAYRNYIAIAFENRIEMFKDEIKYGSVQMFNPNIVRLIKHRRHPALVAGNAHGRIIFADAETLKTLKSVRAFDEPVKHLAALSDGHTITAVAASNDRVKVVNTYGFNREIRFEDKISSIAIGNGVAYIASEGDVNIFTYGGRPVRHFTAHVSEITAMDVRPILVTGSKLGGIAIRNDRQVKRLGGYFVHVAIGKSIYAYVNDGTIRQFDYNGRSRRIDRVGIVYDIVATPKGFVYATDKATIEIVGTRRRYFHDKPLRILAASRRIIAGVNGNEIVYRVGRNKYTLSLDKEIKSIKVRDVGRNSFLLVVTKNEVLLYNVLPKLRRICKIDVSALDADVAMHEGNYLIATTGRYTELRYCNKKIGTIMRPGIKVRLMWNDRRLLLAILGRENVSVRDITDIQHAGEERINVKGTDIDADNGMLSISGEKLIIAHHKGFIESESRVSYGLTFQERLEGYADISGFEERPELLIEAKNKGLIGAFVNKLIDSGLATLRGVDLVMINKRLDKSDVFEIIYW